MGIGRHCNSFFIFNTSHKDVFVSKMSFNGLLINLQHKGNFCSIESDDVRSLLLVTEEWTIERRMSEVQGSSGSFRLCRNIVKNVKVTAKIISRINFKPERCNAHITAWSRQILFTSNVVLHGIFNCYSICYTCM